MVSLNKILQRIRFRIRPFHAIQKKQTVEEGRLICDLEENTTPNGQKVNCLQATPPLCQEKLICETFFLPSNLGGRPLILKELKQKRREIVKPVLIVATVLFVLAVMAATGFTKIESLWFIFPLSGIRVSTLATAIACFAIVLFLQRSNTLKSVYYALLAVIFPMALFEITWYYSAAAFRAWDLRIMQFAALFGWVLLGISAIIHKRPPKISLLLYGIFAFSFSIWIGTGFTFNDLGNTSFSASAEILNVVSKGALFFAYAFHIGGTKFN